MTSRHRDRARRQAAIRANARTALEIAGIVEPPVKLEQLVQHCTDDISIKSHDLKGVANGLLRWNGQRQKFFLYYHPSEYRHRFNLAHELSHYLIDDHCRAIRSRLGEHYSCEGLVTNKLLEEEADIHAAELLIPEKFLSGDEEPCIDDIDRVAKRFDTSFVCAARRIIELSSTPAALIQSDGKNALWGFNNEAFKEEVTDVFWKEHPIPAASITAQVTGHARDMKGPAEGGHWVENAEVQMWEEARYSDEFKYILTILSI